MPGSERGSSCLKNPSSAQNHAITHLSGPAQVIAGPGSGKTYTIVHRILYLIDHHHIRPGEILVVTFAKAAALEMKQRYRQLCDQSCLHPIEPVNFGTFHSICYHILAQSGMLCGKSLIKENEKRKLLSMVLHNHGYGNKYCTEDIDSLLAFISRQKNCGQDDPADLVSGLSFEIPAREIYMLLKEYDDMMKEQRLFDYDDLLLQCLQVFKKFPHILQRFQNQFRYILADEFQDINLPQYQILQLLAAPRNNLFVVGDDDQAIYGFRGATPDIMKRFACDYPEAVRILLTDNYRSGKNIVSLASAVIAENHERFCKQFIAHKEGGTVHSRYLTTRKEEERKLLEDLSALNEERLNHSALILRTNLEAMQYQEILKGEGFSLKEKRKTGLWDDFLLEDISAFLRYLYEGRKRKDFLCFFNKPNRYITRNALTSEQVNEQELAEYYRNNQAMYEEIKKIFACLKIAEGLSPFRAVAFFRNTMGYEGYLREKAMADWQYQSWHLACDRIQELFGRMRPGERVDVFWEYVKKEQGKTETEICQTKGISVLTMHASKGLEFQNVFLPDLNEGIIPGRKCITPKQLEEERRLLYVAITRAEEELFLYYTRERNREMTRFLQGIIPPQ